MFPLTVDLSSSLYRGTKGEQQGKVKKREREIEGERETERERERVSVVGGSERDRQKDTEGSIDPNLI